MTLIARAIIAAFLDMAVKLVIAYQKRVDEERDLAKAAEEHLAVVNRVMNDKGLTSAEADRLLKESARRLIFS